MEFFGAIFIYFIAFLFLFFNAKDSLSSAITMKNWLTDFYKDDLSINLLGSLTLFVSQT